MARPKAPPKEKLPINTTPAPDVRKMATELIAQFFPLLKDLAEAGIECGFWGEGVKMKKFGKVEAPKEHIRTLMKRPGVHFVVAVSPKHWARYDDRQRRQALHNLMCGMCWDGKVASVIGPDFRGYRKNLLDFGGQLPEELETAFRGIQLVLPEMTASEVPVNVDTETGEITEGPSVTLEMGGHKAALTPGTGKNITKALNEKKPPAPRGGKTDGFGNPIKRGAKATGPQQPAAGG